MAPFRIMIVDDDEDDIDLFTDAVSELDPEIMCISAKNGMDALTRLNEEKELPHFIFLDLNMPRLNGKDCLVTLKRSQRLSQIPVVIYTTSRQESDINETRSLGASYFLTKPTKFDELLDALTCIIFSKSPEEEAIDAYLIAL